MVPRPHPFAAFAILVVSALPALPATLSQGLRGSGTIRGRVDVRRPATPPERRPNVADLGARAALGDISDRLTSVVFFESAPRAAAAAAPAHAVLDQRDERFVPHVLAVTTGTVVDFPNSDRIYHNVFSLSKTRPFDLGRYAAGRSKAIKFDRPGIVRVFCDIHSHMNAFILVFDHPFFALTDADGRYRIDNVPAGTYNAGGLERGRLLRSARRHRAGRRRSRTRLRAAMTLAGSLRGRIFLASALLAVLSIGVAIYVVNRQVTRAAESALQREIRATGALVEELRNSAHRHLHGDGPAHRRPAEAQGGGRSPTIRRPSQDNLRDYQEPLMSANLLVVTNATGRVLATSGDSAPAGRVATEWPAVHDALLGHETVGLLPEPDGILQVVTVPIVIGLTEPQILGSLSVGFLLNEALAASSRPSPAATSRLPWAATCSRRRCRASTTRRSQRGCTARECRR